MAALEKIDRGTSFDEHESLRGLLHIQEIGDRLFYAVVEDVEIFSLEAFGEFARRISYQHADVNAINADANEFRLSHGGRSR
jgi:hypothetical protein